MGSPVFTLLNRASKAGENFLQSFRIKNIFCNFLFFGKPGRKRRKIQEAHGESHADARPKVKPRSAELEGTTRLIGTLHPPKRAVSGVYLHIPLGISARRAHLLTEMARLPDGCTLTLPSNSLVNDEVSAMAHARKITLDFIAQRTADGNPGSMHLRARRARSTKAGSAKEPEPILDVAPDWKWERLRLLIDVSGLLYAEYGRERGRAQLPKSTARRESVPTKFLLLLAAHKQWKNPPRDRRDYEATARAFNRLRALLKALVPIHGEPFERVNGKFVPKFRIEFTEATAEAAMGLVRHGIRHSPMNSDLLH